MNKKHKTLHFKEGRSFKLRDIDNYGKKLNYDQFIKESKKQLPFFKERFLDEKKFKITNVEEVLSVKKFKKLCNVSSSMNKDYYPLFTFHGTTSPTTINSIAKYGFLMPGEIHPGTGVVRSIYNGNYFGDGVYTSTYFDISLYYNFLDKFQCIQMLVNVVLLGKLKIIDSKKKSILEEVGVNVPINGLYENKYHTRAKGDLSVVVSGSSEYVFPVFIITVNPSMDFKIKRNENWFGHAFTIDMKESHFRDLDKRDDICKLQMNRITRDLFTVKIIDKPVDPNQKKRKNPYKRYKIKLDYRYHYLVPLSYQSDPNFQFFVKTVQNFISCSSSKHKKLWFFGENVYLYHIKNDDDQAFKNHLMKHKSWKNEFLLECFDHTLDFITKENETIYMEIVYMFIYKPNDVNYMTKLKKLIEKYKKLLPVKNVIIKLICMDEKIKHETIKKRFIPLKFKFQTKHFWESYFHSVGDNKITNIFESLVLENNNIADDELNCNKLNLKIPFPYGVIGQGFVRKFNENPDWDVKNLDTLPLYKGIFIKYIMVNDEPHRVLIEDRMDLKLASKLVVQFLSEFRNYLLTGLKEEDMKRKFSRYENVICILCEAILEVIRTELTKIQALVESREKIKTIKTFYLQISTLLNEMKLFSGVSFKGKWFNMIHNMKFSKKILKRVKNYKFKMGKILKEVGINSNMIKEPDEVLHYCQCSGIGINTIRTNASEIEPWLMKITYVSPCFKQKYTVSLIYNSNEFGVVLRDLNKKIINDILPKEKDFSSEVMKLYLGFAFTRNPYLYMVSQNHSLMTITFVSYVEQIFFKFMRSEVKEIDEDLKNEFVFAFKLLERTKNMVQFNNIINASVNNILLEMGKRESEQEIEKFFTESHGIVSICMLLGGLTLDKCKKIFFDSKGFLSRLCFGVLAECIMRGCRAYLRSTKEDENQHIRRVLGIKDNVVIKDYKFSVKLSQKRTNKFFFKKFSNCSPFSVVSVLEILERYHKKCSLEEIANEFLTQKISMRSFLKRHLQGEKGSYTQVALFLQGMKFHKSKYRKSIRFKKPKEIINEIVEEQLLMIKRKRELIQFSEEKRYVRRLNMIMMAQKYIMYHKVPKIFDWMEINKLNLERPKDDQLELMDSGLLKHHCCYPDCPDYLKNFATETDKKNELKRRPTRHGLFRHLKYNILILNLHVPSFHLVSKAILRKKDITFEEFIKEMDEYFMGNARLKKWYSKCENKDLSLKSVWNFYKKK